MAFRAAKRLVRLAGHLDGGIEDIRNAMLIKFAKHANRPPTMNCVRGDGTATWFTASAANADYFISHDLLHYAVEAILGYTTAFYGLVAAGRDLNDFGSTEGVKDERSSSPEAMDAECLVDLVQALSADGSTPSYQAVAAAWADAVEPHSSSTPPVTEAQLTEICTVWGKLVRRWQTIEVNGALELSFPKPAALTTV